MVVSVIAWNSLNPNQFDITILRSSCKGSTTTTTDKLACLTIIIHSRFHASLTSGIPDAAQLQVISKIRQGRIKPLIRNMDTMNSRNTVYIGCLSTRSRSTRTHQPSSDMKHEVQCYNSISLFVCVCVFCVFWYLAIANGPLVLSTASP